MGGNVIGLSLTPYLKVASAAPYYFLLFAVHEGKEEGGG